MDCEKIKNGVNLILEGIGEDTQREGLRDTPQRVAEFYAEFFSGLGKDPKKEIRVFTTQNHDEMISLAFTSYVSTAI